MAIPTVDEARRYREKRRLTDKQQALVTSVLTNPNLTPAEHVAAAGYLAQPNQIIKNNSHILDKAFEDAGLTKELCVRKYRQCLNAKRVMVRTDKKGVVHKTTIGPDYPVILKTLDKISQLRGWDPGTKIKVERTDTKLLGIEGQTLERLRERRDQIRQGRMIDAECTDEQSTN